MSIVKECHLACGDTTCPDELLLVDNGGDTGIADKKCGFFKWCDMVRSDRRCDVPQSSYGAEVHIPTLKSRGNACIGEKVNSGSGYGRRIPESEPSPKKEELPDSRDQVRDYQSISQRDRCFHCLKQGHWAHECPNRTTKKIELSGGRPTIVDTAVYLNKQCPCGVGACLILTSNTEKNPGRKFYRCPGKAGRKCNFFQWCDLETADERHDALQSVYPLCSCGAGVCSLLTVKNGRNAGRKCFVCPVKRGQGACNFFQWQDAPAKATSTSHLDENKPCSSPNSASYCQNEAGGAMKDNHYNNLEENLTPGLAEEESSLFREFHSKIETDGSGIGIDDCYPPIERLDLE
ncbi:PREDICTED: uncharacterized protein LOC104591895 isoform X2 [Nelumbo nucifera]|uniref:Uncharacterized protein LOC104591895 isoform X2 n=1 Tax=Nelumbo nucifera TaxID=4432 RepID=A0A1U7ZLJ7_NELNU|nr:PREDICTED: uncharacterized protein LOC104591895 isoform X2 [Nelumbo nucifera]